MRRFLPLLSLVIALPLAAIDAPVATILCYHEVDPPAEQHATIPRQSASGDPQSEMLRYTATPEAFRAQLDYLRDRGYCVIALATLVDYLAGRGPSLPEKAVVITVDDGWLCAYTTIMPILRDRGLPWTLFVYPKIVGLGAHAVTWEQIAEMARSGVDVESHTFTHPFLTKSDDLRHELLDSKRMIEAKTGMPVRFLSYPYGDYDDTVAAAAKGYGYEAAVTTWRGPVKLTTPPMQLRRFLIHNDTTLEELAGWLTSGAESSASRP